MKQNDANGHFVFALVLLPLGIFQLFVPEGGMYGIVAVTVALLWLAYAFFLRHRSRKEK